MGNWTPQDWTQFLTAVGVFVGVVLSAIAAFLAALAKIKGDSNEKKIDENTALTRESHEKVSIMAESAKSAQTAIDTAALVSMTKPPEGKDDPNFRGAANP